MFLKFKDFLNESNNNKLNNLQKVLKASGFKRGKIYSGEDLAEFIKNNYFDLFGIKYDKGKSDPFMDDDHEILGDLFGHLLMDGEEFIEVWNSKYGKIEL